MTPEARAAMLAWLLDGLVLRLYVAGGAEYPAATGYAPRKLTAADYALADGGTAAEVDHAWSFAAPGPEAAGCYATHPRVRGAVFREPFRGDDGRARPLAVPVAGTEIRARPRLEVT